VRIKSEHCIGLLKARFQCVQGLRRVISSKHDLALILQMIMCACILHNLLISHAVPQDWMEKIHKQKELEQHNDKRANRRDQILAYMMEMR